MKINNSRGDQTGISTLPRPLAVSQRAASSAAFFRNNLNVILDTLILKIRILIINLNNLRGDLVDIPVEKAPLVARSQENVQSRSANRYQSTLRVVVGGHHFWLFGLLQAAEYILST